MNLPSSPIPPPVSFKTSQITVPAFLPNQVKDHPMINFLTTPQGLTLMGIVVLVGLLSLGEKSSSKKGQLATSYWGGAKERKKAETTALKQIANPKRNEVALSIGMPDPILLKLQEQWLWSGFCQREIKRRCATPRPIYVPNMQQGTLVLGAAGTGKTFSVIDPLIRSMLDQGFPGLLYDFKFPSQTGRVVAYALKRGYNVRFFTPNFPFSDVCNLLDFIKDEEDAVAAGQLAEVIVKNVNLDPNAKGDKFFDDAGIMAVQGMLLLTKALASQVGNQYGDLMTASALLSLPNLGKRLEYARSQGHFSLWTMRPVAQLISVANSPETEASIIGTAQKVFEKFLKKSFISAFSGQSTLPLDLDGKNLLICGLDRNNRDIISPIMAAVIHIIISRNISRTKPRDDSLFVFLDELPTMYLPQLFEWLTQNREDGFCGVIGCQNFAQLEKTYGKEVAKIIFGNCATKFLFNPQEVESAEYFTRILGEFEIKYQTKSRSRNFGRNSGGGSNSKQENQQKRHIWETAQFMKLQRGTAIMINPSYENGEEQYVPMRQKIGIERSEIQEMEWSIGQWEKLQNYFAQQRKVQFDDDYYRQQFDERTALVEQTFPEPPAPNQKGNDNNQPNNNNDDDSHTIPKTDDDFDNLLG